MADTSEKDAILEQKCQYLEFSAWLQSRIWEMLHNEQKTRHIW